MGLIVLAVAILPMLGIGGRQMLAAEVPGPMKESRLTPRVTETAKGLWLIYIAITILCILAYAWGGMGWFDAVRHAFDGRPGRFFHARCQLRLFQFASPGMDCRGIHGLFRDQLRDPFPVHPQPFAHALRTRSRSQLVHRRTAGQHTDSGQLSVEGRCVPPAWTTPCDTRFSTWSR